MELIGKEDSIEMNVQDGILTLKIDTTKDQFDSVKTFAEIT